MSSWAIVTWSHALIHVFFFLEEQVDAVIDETVLSRLLNPPDLSSWQMVGSEEQGVHETLGYLLSWMLMFDHFNDIVSKNKTRETHYIFILMILSAL